MPKKQKRDNAYYVERLKNEFPAVHADLKAGKHKTVAEAAIAAGLKKPRTRLQELKNAWLKASSSEQGDFLLWLTGTGVSVSAAPTPSSSLPFTVAIDRRLTPAAILRINEIVVKRHLEPGDVMTEMGYPKLNTSVSTALRRGWKLKPDVILAVEKWLIANASV